MSNQPAKQPEFSNRHARVYALGLAVYPDTDKLYYGSMCGPAVSCKSIWASICADKAKKAYVTNWHVIDFNGQAPIKTINQTLPGSTFTHLICLSRVDNLILIIEPTAAGVTDDSQRWRLTEQRMATVLAKFTALLNQKTNVPVLPAWAPTIWRHANLNTTAITTLDTYGDCLGAWLIDLTFNWQTLVSELLTSRLLTLTQVNKHSDIINPEPEGI